MTEKLLSVVQLVLLSIVVHGITKSTLRAILRVQPGNASTLIRTKCEPLDKSKASKTVPPADIARRETRYL